MKIILLICSLLSFSAYSSHADENFIFDEKTFLSQTFQQKVIDQIRAENSPNGEAIKKQLKIAEDTKTITIKKAATSAVQGMYNYGKERTHFFTKVYNCGKCDKWHISRSTCWALTEDGIMVSNYHSFMKLIEEGVAVTNYKFEIFPLIEVLIIDKISDFAIFRVKLPEGTKLKTFPIGDPAQPGDDIHLVSHPLKDYYYYNKGYVGGYKMQKNATIKDTSTRLWMRTEISYRKGSSGGAIFNNAGEAVGMVCYISPIFGKTTAENAIGNDNYAVKVLESAVPISSITKRLVIEP